MIQTVNQSALVLDTSALFRAELGKRLRCARFALGKTQGDLAKDVGIARQNLANYENGHCEPPCSLLKQLCEEFGFDAVWLLLGDASRPMFAHPRVRLI